MPNQLNANQKALIRRYLVWCYKTTKEDLDRVERYYTQFLVDQKMLKDLRAVKGSEGYSNLVTDFEAYMKAKKDNADQKKYKDAKTSTLDDNYVYLSRRFAAIEKAIVNFLGKKELAKIESLYETEMTRRILEARDH